MWLMSRALNIGMGWVSILDAQEVMKILKSPAENKLVAYLCIGYVKEFKEIPELEKIGWEKRKSIRTTIYNDVYSDNTSVRNSRVFFEGVKLLHSYIHSRQPLIDYLERVAEGK